MGEAIAFYTISAFILGFATLVVSTKDTVHSVLFLVLDFLFVAALYVLLVTWIGIYVSSLLFIGFFMRWLGKYSWWKVIGVSLGTVVIIYLVFEKWFKVPLPKGPLENLLGLG